MKMRTSNFQRPASNTQPSNTQPPSTQPSNTQPKTLTSLDGDLTVRSSKEKNHKEKNHSVPLFPSMLHCPRSSFDIRIFLFLSLVLTTVTHAQSTQPALAPRDLLANLQKKLLTVTSIQADFTQLKKLSVMKHTLKITGHFAMEKPDRFVWLVKDPVQYAIKVQGQDITQWDADTNQVQVMHAANDPTFKAVTDQIQAWFLGDYKALEKSYDVYLLSEKPLALRFAPRGDSMVAKLIKNIEITFADNQLEIEKMAVNEASGDTTVINYSNILLNQSVPAVTWEIPPK